MSKISFPNRSIIMSKIPFLKIQHIWVGVHGRIYPNEPLSASMAFHCFLNEARAAVNLFDSHIAWV